MSTLEWRAVSSQKPLWKRRIGWRRPIFERIMTSSAAASQFKAAWKSTANLNLHYFWMAEFHRLPVVSMCYLIHNNSHTQTDKCRKTRRHITPSPSPTPQIVNRNGPIVAWSGLWQPIPVASYRHPALVSPLILSLCADYCCLNPYRTPIIPKHVRWLASYREEDIARAKPLSFSHFPQFGTETRP